MLKLHFLGFFMPERINHAVSQKEKERKRNSHINNRVRLKRSPQGTSEQGNRASEKVTHLSMCFSESTDSRVKESCRAEGGCRLQGILA